MFNVEFKMLHNRCQVDMYPTPLQEKAKDNATLAELTRVTASTSISRSQPLSVRLSSACPLRVNIFHKRMARPHSPLLSIRLILSDAVRSPTEMVMLTGMGPRSFGATFEENVTEMFLSHAFPILMV